jgi:nitrogen fixation protein NifZ
MSDPAEPRFRWGQPVCATVDLFNDGSYPDWPQEALLVSSGEQGDVVQIGAHVESSTNVYLVEFSRNRVVGCLEAELAPAFVAAPTASSESSVP